MKVNTRLKMIYKNCHSLSISNPITTASPDMEGHTTLYKIKYYKNARTASTN